ncbi:MAG: hypothetical protein AABZ06_09215 [Bdellovibrionota bacterium]
MKPRWKCTLIFLLTLIPINENIADTKNIPRATNPCSPREQWTLPNSLPANSAEIFLSSLRGSIKSVRSFAEALTIRRKASSPQSLKLFAEYWISRSLYEAGLIHAAHAGFSATLAKKAKSTTSGIRLAALGCLIAIHDRYTSIQLDPGMSSVLHELSKNAVLQDEFRSIHDAALLLLFDSLGGDKPNQNIIGLLRGSGAHWSLAKGVLAATENKHDITISELSRFITSETRSSRLHRYDNQARLLMARAYYSNMMFDKASAALKEISKQSNELVTALSELAWAQLSANQLHEAIGTTLSLFSGGLRRTFTPESPMILAMAFNELCRYPEAINASNLFRAQYAATRQWLVSFAKKPYRLYGSATAALVATIQDEPRAPDHVISEWLRSPVFISHQEEINLTFSESKSAEGFAISGQAEQHDISTQAVALIDRLTPQVSTQSLSSDTDATKMLIRLRNLLLSFHKMQAAAPIWKILHGNQSNHMAARKTNLLANIERDLHERTLRMLWQLDEVAENIRLLEVEVYGGATKDIIKQHIDKAAKIKKENPITKTTGPKTWDWGTTRLIANSGSETEVWEDELGSFKADLTDKCGGQP